MPALLYDETIGAFKEAAPPMIWYEGLPKVVSWATGTDDEIKALIQAADEGRLDLHDYAGWSIGDERVVHLSAMAATGVGESHAEQDVTFVLMHKGLYKKSADNTEVNFVVGMKSGLAEPGYINAIETNSGSWSACARRAWCNSVFYEAVSLSIRSIFKQVKVTTATEWNASTVTQTDDYFFLPAAAEVWKGNPALHPSSGGGYVLESAFSTRAEFDILTRFDYHNPDAKFVGCWHRSPAPNYNYYWCYTLPNGKRPDGAQANITSNYFAVYGCI